MRLTPLDIRNHVFRRRLRGADADEVRDFLGMVSEDYESLALENETLRETVRRLEARLEEQATEEKSLRDTLLTARTLSEDLRRTAARESEALVGEAEVRAEKILDAAHRRLSKLTDDIREMKLLRGRIAAAVRSTLETHLQLVEGLSQEPPEDPLVDGKVAFLTRGRRAAAGAAEPASDSGEEP